MEIVPPENKATLALMPSIIALIPLYALQIFVVNPFLAFTTFFPIAILTYGTAFQSALASVLGVFMRVFFQKSLETGTDSDLIVLFFLSILILTLLLHGLEWFLKRFDVGLRIDWRHAVALMTVVYAAAWFLNPRDSDMPPIFLLMFYLFNVYSIFSYYVVGLAFEKLRQSQPILRKII